MLTKVINCLGLANLLTAGTVVRGSRVFGVPSPTLPLRPINEVHYLSFGRIERFQMVVVVATVDPVH